MTGDVEWEITADLLRAFEVVLGSEPTKAEPVVILATYVHRLARGYGLSDSQRLEQSPLDFCGPPPPAAPLVTHFLPETVDPIDGDGLRDRLYSVFVDLADDVRARGILNRRTPLSEVGLLKVAQVFWNLEATIARPRLPIRPGRIVERGSSVAADIPVPGSNKDFARMEATERAKEGATGLGPGVARQSKGQAFRTKGARLSVLAAQHLIAARSQSVPDPTEAILHRTDSGRIVIAWPSFDAEDCETAPPTAHSERETRDVLPLPLATEGRVTVSTSRSSMEPVLVGTPAAVSSAYQRRGFDDEIDRLWSTGGDRRVWLRGGPGMGKSYTARRVMQEALARHDDDREVLLIWVDSADPQSVRQALSNAAERMPDLGIAVVPPAPDRLDRQARALLEVLTRSPWRWLIILDNADVASLIDTRLIPTGSNPNGRVLITTLSRDHRMAGSGHVVAADLYTPSEAEAFLRAQLDPTNGRPAPLARSSTTDTSALAASLGYHPLALSIAAATIIRDRMDIEDWITEFDSAKAMDETADAHDVGGYPHLLGATWRLALGRASQGLPEGMVERAAMVAALQDPDGHPTWLWDRDTVTAWVCDGSTLARRHGVPIVVQRLMDYGVLELIGDTWKQGKVAIHRLAARTVRELAGTDKVFRLASVLLDEWLLKLTDPGAPAPPHSIHRNVGPIAALPELPEATRHAATALLQFKAPPSPDALEFRVRIFDEFAPYFRQGGAIGLAELADKRAEFAADELALGRASEAREKFAQSVRIYLQLIENQSVPDELRADYLMRLAQLEGSLGESESARDSSSRAIRLYERLTEKDVDYKDLESLVALVKLHERLGNIDEKNRVLSRVDRYLKHYESAGPASDDSTVAFQRGKSLWHLGKQFLVLGRSPDAKHLLEKAVENFRRMDSPEGRVGDFMAAQVLEDLVEIHIGAGHWQNALNCLTEISSEFLTAERRVLLASVQKRVGRLDEVTTNLSAAARAGRALIAEERRDEPEFVDQGLLEEVRGVARNFMETRLKELFVDALRREMWDDAAGLSAGFLEIAQKRAATAPGDYEEELATAHLAMGMSLLRLDRLDESENHLTRSTVLFEMLSELDPENGAHRQGLATSLTMLGSRGRRLGKLGEATEMLSRSVSLWQELSNQSPDDESVIGALDEALSALASIHLLAGRPDETIECCLRRVNIWKRSADQNPIALGFHRGLAAALHDLGSAHFTVDRPSDAIQPLTDAAGNWQAASELAPSDQTSELGLARTRFLLSMCHNRLYDNDTAWSFVEQAIRDLQSLTQRHPDSHEAQMLCTTALAFLGGLQQARGLLADAAESLEGAVNICQLFADLAPGEHEPTLVVYLRRLAEIQDELGRTKDASAITARINDLVRRFPELSD